MSQKIDIDSIQKLIEVIKHLRSPEGCPWDRKQTHVSLKPMLVEETAELLDAIDAKDDENIREELGDILMHIVFHSLIAEDEKRFTFADVVKEVAEKMERRHPHIFGSAAKLEEADQVVELWKEIKAKEKAAKGIASSYICICSPASSFNSFPRIISLVFFSNISKTVRPIILSLATPNISSNATLHALKSKSVSFTKSGLGILSITL